MDFLAAMVRRLPDVFRVHSAKKNERVRKSFICQTHRFVDVIRKHIHILLIIIRRLERERKRGVAFPRGQNGLYSMTYRQNNCINGIAARWSFQVAHSGKTLAFLLLIL